MDEVTCQKCGSRVIKRGFQVFAVIPHKRQRYQCTVCGHTFVPGLPEEEQKETNESQ